LREEPLQLLAKVKGLKLVDMAHFDECCGFGGTFATKYGDISVAMGESKVDYVTKSGAEYVTATDPSCLMHVEGVLGRRKSQVKTIYLGSILASQIG
jgi:L-lactate dehydrogenase complex protein LldE